MHSINVSGTKFILSKGIIEQIPFLQGLLNNKEWMGHKILFIQQDPKIFQQLLNFLSLPGYKIPDKYYVNFMALARMFLLMEPLELCSHEFHLYLRTGPQIEYLSNVYQIKDIYVITKKDHFSGIGIRISEMDYKIYKDQWINKDSRYIITDKYFIKAINVYLQTSNDLQFEMDTYKCYCESAKIHISYVKYVSNEKEKK